MPVPRPDQVSALVSDLVAAAGLDLEDVTVTAAGRRSVVRVVVGSDEPLDLDAVADLSRDVSEVLDGHDAFGEAPYTLEVTSPGVDRPLTEPRHWRRARGRRVAATVAGEALTARVGPVAGEVVSLVVPGPDGPVVREVALAEVSGATVEVEFSRADPREVELAGTPAGPARGADDELVGEGEPDDAERDDDERDQQGGAAR